MKTKHMDLACYSILLVAVAIVGIQLTSPGSASGQVEEESAQSGPSIFPRIASVDNGAEYANSAEIADSAGGRDGAGNNVDGAGNGIDGSDVTGIGGRDGTGTDGKDGADGGTSGEEGLDGFDLQIEATIP